MPIAIPVQSIQNPQPMILPLLPQLLGRPEKPTNTEPNCDQCPNKKSMISHNKKLRPNPIAKERYQNPQELKKRSTWRARAIQITFTQGKPRISTLGDQPKYKTLGIASINPDNSPNARKTRRRDTQTR